MGYQSNGFLYHFHCQFDTLFRHHMSPSSSFEQNRRAVGLKRFRLSDCEHQRREAIDRKSLHLKMSRVRMREWGHVGRKWEVHHVPCSEAQVADVLIGAYLCPPSTINPLQPHPSCYLLDSRHLSLWCGVITGSKSLQGMLAIFEWTLPAFVLSYGGTVVPYKVCFEKEFHPTNQKLCTDIFQAKHWLCETIIFQKDCWIKLLIYSN